MRFSINSKCPCGSGKKYKECCQMYHKGSRPKDALLLMKSRFSAYAAGEAKYIMKTTHPQNPDFKEDKKLWEADILAFGRENEFVKLNILETTLNDEVSFVAFEAVLKQNGQIIKLIEHSRFEKVGDNWLYHSGEIVVN